MSSYAPAAPWCPPACVCRLRDWLPANTGWNSARWIPPAASPPAQPISKFCSVGQVVNLRRIVNPPALKFVGQPILAASRLSGGSFGPGAPLLARIARWHKEVLGRETAAPCHAKAILDLADALGVPVRADGEFRAGGFGAANEGRTRNLEVRSEE